MYQIEDEIKIHPFYPVTLSEVNRHPQYIRSARVRALKRQYKSMLRVIDDCQETIRTIDRLISESYPPYTLSAESGVEDPHMSSGIVRDEVKAVHENLVDVGGQVTDQEASGFSSVARYGQSSELSVNGVLERPIPITNFLIGVGSGSNAAISVWDLYSLNPTIRAKLRNFAYLRGNLHVRVNVSGTPFHYGHLLLSYQPYPLRNETLIQHEAVEGVTILGRPSMLNYLSQSPGSRVIDVRDNKPVEIVCPFISTKPMHRLFNSSTAAIGAATSYDDLENAGDLYIYSLNDIGSVSATPSEVSVYVYAWMTDVELGTTTATQVGITTESGVETKDERETGPIEKFASNVATISGYMEKAPVIGPFAKASSIAFGAVSKVASIFGWSRPNLISEPIYMKNLAFQNGANTIGSETTFKITLDPKQELTVDPRVLGDGKDEMEIAYIASIPSYLHTFNWNDDSSIMASPIFTCAVFPYLYTFWEDLSNEYYQPTAMAFAAQPFFYWRGVIKFRFDIVCSAFHRGKLAFFYEPNSAQHTLINTAIATNKQYMRVIDIQETQSIEFCIDWAHPRPWAESPNMAQLNEAYGANVDLDDFLLMSNGYIGVTPMTGLQSPDDSDVSINVYVSAEELNVNFMTSSRMPTSRLVAESGVEPSKEYSCLILNESTASTSHISEDFFGEQPLSFRALCKRYVHSVTESLAASALTIKNIRLTYLNFPAPNPIYGGSTSNVDLFGYLRYAYVGLRGGIRKRIHPWVDGQSTQYLQMKASIESPTIAVVTGLSVLGSAQDSDLNGTVTIAPAASGGLEYEIPFYTNNLFVFSFADDLVGTNNTGEMNDRWSKSHRVSIDASGATSAGEIVQDSAIAEDFTFLRYQGAPFWSQPV